MSSRRKEIMKSCWFLNVEIMNRNYMLGKTAFLYLFCSFFRFSSWIFTFLSCVPFVTARCSFSIHRCRFLTAPKEDFCLLFAVIDFECLWSASHVLYSSFLSRTQRESLSIVFIFRVEFLLFPWKLDRNKNWLENR